MHVIQQPSTLLFNVKLATLAVAGRPTEGSTHACTPTHPPTPPHTHAQVTTVRHAYGNTMHHSIIIPCEGVAQDGLYSNYGPKVTAICGQTLQSTKISRREYILFLPFIFLFSPFGAQTSAVKNLLKWKQ